MKRRNFLRNAAIGAASCSMLPQSLEASSPPSLKGKEIYELREYEITEPSRQEFLHKYLQYALIPALNRHGIDYVGVFREMNRENPVRIFVLIPHCTERSVFRLNRVLKGDWRYMEKAKEFLTISEDEKVYQRYHTTLLEAFETIPKIEIPASEKKVFELRTYESYNVDAGQRKIAMFNKEEITLFRKVGLKPVFFGQVVAGANQPALTYMLTFRSLEERERNWKTFVDHEEWKTMKEKEEYKNTVSKVTSLFLESMDYSQI